MKAEVDFGAIVKNVICMNLCHLDAIQDYALAVEKDIQTNGLLCYSKRLKKLSIFVSCYIRGT